MPRLAALAAASALLALAAPAPAGAAADPPGTRAWAVTAGGPTTSELSVTTWEQPGRTGVSMLAAVTGAGPAQALRALNVGRYGLNVPHVYGMPGCPEAACAAVVEAGGRFGIRTVLVGARAGLTRVVVGVTNVDVTIEAGPGWVVTQLPPTAFRAFLAEQADEAGVAVLGRNAGHFASATAPGGDHGSVAFATPPCGYDAGTGGVRLTGGLDPVTLVCPRDPRTFRPYDTAAAETAWRLTGPATGVNGFPVRLAVVDLPRPGAGP